MDFQSVALIGGAAVVLYMAYASFRAFFPSAIRRGTHAGQKVHVFSPGEGVWMGITALIFGCVLISLVL